MVKLRLKRVGAKKRPVYRVVAADSRAPRDGAFIETIGHYNPLTDPETVVIDEEKALKWLRCGAQPTDTVARLLRKLSIMDKFRAPIEVVPSQEAQELDEAPFEAVAGEDEDDALSAAVSLPNGPPKDDVLSLSEDDVETAGDTHKEPHS